jgi:hypothetical protein
LNGRPAELRLNIATKIRHHQSIETFRFFVSSFHRGLRGTQWADEPETTTAAHCQRPQDWDNETDLYTMGQCKATISDRELLRNLPLHFLDIVRDLKTLTFESTVTYDRLISLVSNAIIDLNCAISSPDNWEVISETKERENFKKIGWKLPRGCDYATYFPILKRQASIAESRALTRKMCQNPLAVI